MFNIGLFKNIFSGKNKSFREAAEDVMRGTYRKEIEEIRRLRAEGKEKEADGIEKSLPTFPPEANDDLLRLDIEGLTPQEAAIMRPRFCGISYTQFCSESPSGNGLNIWVKRDKEWKPGETAYRKAREYYARAMGLKEEVFCQDLTKPCRVGYSPDACYRDKPEPFTVHAAAQNSSEQAPVPKEGTVDFTPSPSFTAQNSSEQAPVPKEGTVDFTPSPSFMAQNSSEQASASVAPAPEIKKAEDVSPEARAIFNQQLQMVKPPTPLLCLARNCRGAGLELRDMEKLASACFNLSKEELQPILEKAYSDSSPVPPVSPVSFLPPVHTEASKEKLPLL